MARDAPRRGPQAPAPERPADELLTHLRVALEAGDLGTWRWDIATGATTWDATMERLCGLPPGTFDGTYDAWVALLHPDDVDHALATVAEAVERGGSYELEHRIVWPDGSIRWLHGRGTVTRDDDGAITGTIGCAADVTARKLWEIETVRRARHAEELAKREQIQRKRLEFLTALDAAALDARDHRDLMRRVTHAAVPELGDWCGLHFATTPGATPDVEIAHHDPARVRWAKALRARFPHDVDAATGVPAVTRSGKLLFHRDLDAVMIDEAFAAMSPEPAQVLAAAAAELHLTSAIVVPLRTKRGVVGVMQFVSAESKRRYDNDDVTLAQAAAGRVAAALDSAWQTAQQRMIAMKLQAALLPPRLPEIPGVDIAVRYWAAGAVSDVGGDFFDVFTLGDRCWALVIGDVCGSGADAAAVTAIARHTMRAAATHGEPPTEVLRWVNDALHAGNRGLYCTALYSTLESLEDGTWRYTSVAGGHPLPLVVPAGGPATPVGHPGTLLGILPDVAATEHEVVLAEGDTLVLYTDGVTDVAPPYGLDPAALHEMVTGAAAGAATAEEVAARIGTAIAEVLPIPERDDDIAIVVARVG